MKRNLMTLLVLISCTQAARADMQSATPIKKELVKVEVLVEGISKLTKDADGSHRLLIVGQTARALFKGFEAANGTSTITVNTKNYRRAANDTMACFAPLHLDAQCAYFCQSRIDDVTGQQDALRIPVMDKNLLICVPFNSVGVGSLLQAVPMDESP